MAGVVGDSNKAGQYLVLNREHDLQRRLEFVLEFLPVIVWVQHKIGQPHATQCHLLTSSAVWKSAAVK